MTDIKRVLVFEDDPEDLKRFSKNLTDLETLFVDHCDNEKFGVEIGGFEPDLAIVDSRFESDGDGVGIVHWINQRWKDLPIIVCTILLSNSAKKMRTHRLYKGLPGVVDVIGKNPFPTAEEIRDICSE